MFKLVEACSNLFNLFKTCTNLFVLFCLFCLEFSSTTGKFSSASSVGLKSLFSLVLSMHHFFFDCNQPTLIADEYCNDKVNILDCGYDGGDCCGLCLNTDLCTNCSCLGNITGNGSSNALVGDGPCNDETNTQKCNYDGGDCCGSSIITDLCTNCSCIKDIFRN